MYYSNEASLKAEWGVDEVESVLASEPASRAARLEKALNTAMGEINSYIATAGYVIPFLFTEWGNPPPPDGSAPLLTGDLQATADALAMFHLCNRTDFQKKQYEDAHSQWVRWLEKVRTAEIRLPLVLVTGPIGSSNARTIARPQVFTGYVRREPDIFGWPWRG